MSLRLVPCRLAAALLFPGWGRPALAALALVGSASLAHAADALRIEHLLLSADASLNLRSGVNSADFASGGQSLDQLDGLIGAPAITASALDVPQGFTSPTGLSFAFSQQANTAYYRDRISVVNDYPGDTPHYTQGLPTQVSVRTSTAYDLDYNLAYWRACYTGQFTWLNTVERGSQYAAGDAWGCIGTWNSGRWHTATGDAYVAAVQKDQAQRVWTTPGFLGS